MKIHIETSKHIPDINFLLISLLFYNYLSLFIIFNICMDLGESKIKKFQLEEW